MNSRPAKGARSMNESPLGNLKPDDDSRRQDDGMMKRRWKTGPSSRSRMAPARWRMLLISLLAVAGAAVLLLEGTGCSESTTPMTDAGKLQRMWELFQSDKESYFAGAPEISVAQLTEWLKDGRKLVIVDVRDKEEQDVSMIPGAIRVQDFDPDSTQYTDHVVVAYCTIGTRSGILVNELRDKNIEAYNLAGSILAWTHAGLPLVDAHGETRRVHVYGKKWDLAATGYETVW